jgi:replication-associated recombination protein RarA
MSGFRPSEQTTRGGYELGELASAIAKATRRRDCDLLLWAVSELHLSGFGAYAARRLVVAASEEIGPAAPPGLIADVHALHDAFVAWEKREKDRPPQSRHGALLLAHMALLVGCAPVRSRMADNAGVVYWQGPREPRKLPPWVLDHHTRKGRAAGRSIASCYEESYRLAEPTLPDPYEGRAREIDGL